MEQETERYKLEQEKNRLQKEIRKKQEECDNIEEFDKLQQQSSSLDFMMFSSEILRKSDRYTTFVAALLPFPKLHPNVQKVLDQRARERSEEFDKNKSFPKSLFRGFF
jgi:3-methyladenine DNA glycosylase/8-oxoguanine DNA glycosylase